VELISPCVALTPGDLVVTVAHSSLHATYDLHGLLHLRVLCRNKMVRQQFNWNTGRHTFAFDKPPLPREIRSHGQTDDISFSRAEGAPAQEPAGCLNTHNCGEVTFFGEGSQHFAGTGSVLIYKNDDPTVESSFLGHPGGKFFRGRQKSAQEKKKGAFLRSLTGQ
jgi:hypothetical protein